VRILFITSRFPEFRQRGDQSRLFGQIRYLAEAHELTVLSCAPPSSDAARARLLTLANVHVHAPGPLTRALSAAGMLLRGGPGQVGWMMTSSCWRRAHPLAELADVVVVSTARSARGPLPAPLVIDYVDSLSANMRIRARGPEGPARRTAARVEAPLMERWERRVSSWSAAAVATSDLDASRLPPNPPVVVCPLSWDGEIPGWNPADERDIDVIFTGNMNYPPNRAAATLLAEEILPAVRAQRPNASALVVGRNADELSLPDVAVEADVADVTAYLRRAKVAVAPLVGTGSPYKVLEAAASGAAVVGSSYALGSFDMDGVVASEPTEYASAVLGLLEDEARRRTVVEASLAAVREHSFDAVGKRFESLLDAVAASGRGRSE
jgi:hypothetical protein